MSKQLKTCDLCDYYHCCAEFGDYRPFNKRDTRKAMLAATVCVKPDSPNYGRRRKRGDNKSCEKYSDYFNVGDRDVEVVRAEQVHLVDKYRVEKLGMEPTGTIGIAPWSV